MSVGLSLLIIFISCIALVKGVDLFIKSASNIAHRLKVSEYTISFLLVAIGTSLPEAVVAITSGLEKNSILAFGNAVGSNMALMTIVVAIPALLGAGLSTRAAIHSRDIYYTALFSILPLGLIIDGTLGRLDGAVLLLSYIIYAGAVLRRATGLEGLKDTLTHRHTAKDVVIFAGALILLLGTSELIVRSAINISTQLKISLGLIGLTVTAIGTALPEIAFSLGAVNRHVKEKVLGNIIGSVVANSTLVLGIAALVYPIDIKTANIGLSTMFFMILILLFFLWFARSREKLDRQEGMLLIIIYILFITAEFFLSTT